MLLYELAIFEIKLTKNNKYVIYHTIYFVNRKHACVR